MYIVAWSPTYLVPHTIKSVVDEGGYLTSQIFDAVSKARAVVRVLNHSALHGMEGGYLVVEEVRDDL